MTLPNLITIARLILVPVAVWLVSDGHLAGAFWVFVIAGVSDGVDGFIAKRFDLVSELGTLLDPIADKALLVSMYVTLAMRGDLPVWLTILVVSRDLLIVGAIILPWMLAQPVRVHPLAVSKGNTLAQILLVGTVLADHAYALGLEFWIAGLVWIVAALTVASAGAYLVQWVRHMADGGSAEHDGKEGSA